MHVVSSPGHPPSFHLHTQNAPLSSGLSLRAFTERNAGNKKYGCVTKTQLITLIMVFPKENLTYLDMIACKMEAVMGCRLCFDKLREIQGSES